MRHRMFRTLKIVVGTFLRPLRYAQRRPLKIALLAILVWIAFMGLQRANLDTAPMTPAGIAQAVLVGEQRAFGEVGWLDRKEQYALRRTAEKDGNRRNLAIILLLMNTGLRVSEVAGLRLDDLQLSERKGEVTVRGKGLKVRTVPLNADVRKALRDYLAKRPKAEHDAVFVGQKGDPLGKLGIEYQIATLGRLSGFVGSNGAAERLTPHMLRHTFAKNLVDQGVGLDQVAMLMGHRSLTTTARYTKPSKQDLAKAVEKLEER